MCSGQQAQLLCREHSLVVYWKWCISSINDTAEIWGEAIQYLSAGQIWLERCEEALAGKFYSKGWLTQKKYQWTREKLLSSALMIIRRPFIYFIVINPIFAGKTLDYLWWKFWFTSVGSGHHLYILVPIDVWNLDKKNRCTFVINEKQPCYNILKAHGTMFADKVSD